MIDVSTADSSLDDPSSNRKVLHSTAIAPPKFAYSPCIRIGPMVQVSGMVALDPATGTLVEGGPGAEVSRILKNLLLAMPDYEVSLEDLLMARLFTTRFNDFEQINIAWAEVFSGRAVPPARTAVGVSALPLGASVEIEFTFVKSM